MHTPKRTGNPESSTDDAGRLRTAWVAVEPTPYDLPLIEALKNVGTLDLCFYTCIPEARFPWIDHDRLNRLCPPLNGVHFVPPGKDVTGTLNVAVLQELWRNRFDLVTIAGWGNPTCLLAAVICLIRRIPFFLRSDTRLVPGQAVRRSWLQRLLVFPIIRRSWACLGISRPAMDFFTHAGVPKEKLFLVPCLSHLDEYRQNVETAGETRDSVRSRLGTPQGACVGVFAGRLEEVKGVDLLLEGLRLLSPEERPTLWIAGDGSQREQLERFARLHSLPVRFLGFQRNDKLPLYYSCADFLALPSRREPWGIVVAEAMACGLPVVLSEHVGARFDLLEEDRNGFLVRGDDPSSWSEVLRRCVVEHERLASMGACALELTSKFGKEASVQSFLAAVSSVFPAKTPCHVTGRKSQFCGLGTPPAEFRAIHDPITDEFLRESRIP